MSEKSEKSKKSATSATSATSAKSRIPHLEPKARLAAIIGGVAVLVLIAVGVVVVLRADDAEPTASSQGTATAEGAEGDATTAGEGGTDAGADPDADQSRASATTTDPGGAGTDPGSGSEDPGAGGDPGASGQPGGTGEGGGDPGGAPGGGDPGGAPGGGDPGGAPGGGDTPDGGSGGSDTPGGGGAPGEGSSGGGQPAARGPAGGGEGANVNSGEIIEPESPPVRGTNGPQGPTRSEECPYTGPPTKPLPVTDGPGGDGSRWVTVGSLEGNCGGRTGFFPTTGVDSRLVYRSDAEQMLVFIDEEGNPDGAAGFADVECRSSCANTRIQTFRAGSYRIRVDGTDGPWIVELQELRR